MNFTSLPNGQVDGFFLLKRCDKKLTKNGNTYLDLVLSDIEGEISAKLWDYDERLHSALETGKIVKTRGTLEMYKEKEQFRVALIREVTPADDYDIKSIIASAPVDSTWMKEEIYSVVNSFEDEELKKIVKFLLDEREELLEKAPAALSMHHAFPAGLLNHTLSIVRVAQRVCDIYPMLDRDLLLAGAVVHDLAKIDEFELDNLGLVKKYSVDGELVGHLVRGAVNVEKAAEKLGTPKQTALLLEHMVISHHEKPEFGAAKMPSFIEAEVLAQLDNLDATVFEFTQAVNGVEAGEFSQRIWGLDNRKVYNHARKEGAEKFANLKN